MSTKIENCPDFKTRALVPIEGEPQTCGLCAVNATCPIRRSPDFNGRKQYLGMSMNTELAALQDRSATKFRGGTARDNDFQH